MVAMHRAVLAIVVAAIMARALVSAEEPAQKVPSDEAKRWAIASGAVLVRLQDARLDGLDWLDREPMCQMIIKSSLQRWWDVSNKRELMETLKWIDDQGHRAQFDRIASALASLDDPENARYIEEMKATAEGKHQISVVERHRENLGRKSLLGWDYSRYVNVVRQAYYVGYLTEKEAWELIMPAARKLQQTFESWEDLGENYIIGTEFWSEAQYKQRRKTLETICENLLGNPESPWSELPWDTKLD